MAEVQEKEWIGKKIWTWLWWFIKNAVWYTADLWESAWKGVTKLGIDTVDLLWDVWAIWTDIVTNAVTWWSWTNLSGKEWILDKYSKKSKEFLDKNGDVIKSEWWKTDIGKAWLNIAEKIPEVASYFYWWAWLFKWVKLSKEAYNVFKNVPKAKAELKALANAWKEVSQSQVDDILKKYSGSVVKKTEEALAKDPLKNNDVLDKISKYTPEQIEKLPNELKTKVLNYIKNNKIKTWLAWTATVVWLWQANESWIELDQWEQPNEELSQEDLNKLQEHFKSNEDVKPTSYRNREIKKVSDWTFEFVWMDWNRKQFNSEEEAKKYIDYNVKNYNQVEIKKAMSWKTPEEMFKWVIKFLWLQPNATEQEIIDAVEKKWISVEEFKKLIQDIKSEEWTLSI